jgi:hypothetical protein
MKLAVSAMLQTNEDAALQRRRSRRQQQQQADADAIADADDVTRDYDVAADAAQTAAGSSPEQQQQPQLRLQPQKERQIVQDLGKQALVEYRRSMAAQQRQAKSITQKLQLLRQAWIDAEPPVEFDGAKIVGGYEAAVQLNLQYRSLLEDIKQQSQAIADAASAGAANCSSSSSSSDASSAAGMTGVDLGAWRRTRASVLQQMKVKDLQAVLEAAGWEPPPKKSAKSKNALMQVGAAGVLNTAGTGYARVRSHHL